MPTRLVITGASGNVGTALLHRLADAGGYTVTGVTRRRPPDTGIYRSARWRQLDLAEHDATTRLQAVMRDADAVVHLAWGFQPTRNVQYLDAVGVGGTRAVLRAADVAGVGQLVHIRRWAPMPPAATDSTSTRPGRPRVSTPRRTAPRSPPPRRCSTTTSAATATV